MTEFAPALMDQGAGDGVLIPRSLIAAYEAAHYGADLPSGRIVIEIGRPCPSTDALPIGTRLAVVTAWNPFSKVLSDAENASRHQALVEAIHVARLAWYPAFGGDPTGEWEPEISAAVVDPSDELLDQWMIRFGQNAVVVAVVGGLAHLRLHPWAVIVDG